MKKTATFAPLNAIGTGAIIGGGLGFLRGTGFLESAETRAAMSPVERMKKLTGNVILGTAVGAGTGYGVKRYNRYIADTKLPPVEIKISPPISQSKPAPKPQPQSTPATAPTLNVNSQQVGATTPTPPKLTRWEQFKEQKRKDWEQLKETMAEKARNDIEARKQVLGFENQMNNPQYVNFAMSVADTEKLISGHGTYIPQLNAPGLTAAQMGGGGGKSMPKRFKNPRPYKKSIVGKKDIEQMLDGDPTKDMTSAEYTVNLTFNDIANFALPVELRLSNFTDYRAVMRGAKIGGVVGGIGGAAKGAGVFENAEQKANTTAGKRALNVVGGIVGGGVVGHMGGSAVGSGVKSLRNLRKKPVAPLEALEAVMSGNNLVTAEFAGAWEAVKNVGGNYKNNFLKGGFNPTGSAANIGTVVGATGGALSGMGIGETEYEKATTGAAGRVGKILGKSAVGGVLGRTVGAAGRTAYDSIPPLKGVLDKGTGMVRTQKAGIDERLKQTREELAKRKLEAEAIAAQQAQAAGEVNLKASDLYFAAFSAPKGKAR